MQRIILEDFKNRLDDVRSVPENPKGLLRAPPEDTFSTRHTKAIYDVSSQPEGHTLSDSKEFALRAI